MIKNKIDKFKKSKKYSISKNFSIFTIIGAIQSLLQIFFLWLLIDILKYPSLLMTSVVISTLYLVKYYAYIKVGLMYNKFIKYNMVNFSLFLLNIVAIWILIDFFGLYASISSIIVISFLFILRFMVLNKFGLIKNESANNIMNIKKV